MHSDSTTPRNPVTCRFCGQIFHLKPSQAKPRGNYCSRACHNTARTRQFLSSIPRNPVTCRFCGRVFHLKSSHVKLMGNYCSRACQYAARTRPSLTDAFWAKVAIGAPDECWPWKAGRDRDGYGRFHLSYRKYTIVHRFAYLLANGLIQGDWLVCHSCDNPPCCNPKHLWLGSNSDNMRDRHEKGRTARGDASGPKKYPENYPRGDNHWTRHSPEKVRRGEANPASRATEPIVRELRRRYAAGNTSFPKLAREFGLSINMVFCIVRHRTWTHVSDP